jgi:thymidylate synthase (FAD)
MKISKQSVQLVDNMGTDLSVVNAARVSFDKEASHYTEEQNSKLISYLANHNHWSPFAHTSISLRIKAPIFLSRQLAKHQVGGAWNEVSRRYVDSEPEFYFPGFGKWRKRSLSAKQGSAEEGATLTPLYNGQEDLWADYDNKFDPDIHVSVVVEECLSLYKDLVTSGVCPEQARMILPQNTMTEWIWTGSVYFFSRVCNLRLDPHAQLEVQEVAKLISDTIRPLYPESWKVLVDDKQKA